MAISNNQLGTQARTLIRSKDRGYLATTMRDDGFPYASLVMIACASSGDPLLLISELAEHTQNILAKEHIALLVDNTKGLNNPLTGTRVTLMGSAEKSNDQAHMARYIARHPNAAIYCKFSDFSLYRLTVERVHIVAGFGSIHWIDRAEFVFHAKDDLELKESESDIVNHMNYDHADAIQLCAKNLLGLQADEWIMTGVDPEGCDLRLAGTVARLTFDATANTKDEVRKELIKLTRKARETC